MTATGRGAANGSRLAVLAALLFAGGTHTAAAQASPATVTPDAYIPHLTFDVASIHEVKGATMRSYDNPSDNSYFAGHAVSLQSLIFAGYKGILMFAHMEGVPAWGKDIDYEVTAKGDNASDMVLQGLSEENRRAEKRHMVQVLLAERFHLQIVEETRMAGTYDLYPTKNTSRLIQIMPDDPKYVSTCGFHRVLGKGYEIVSRGCPFTILVSNLQQNLQTPVIDHTGIQGYVAFHLMWSPQGMPRDPQGEAFPDMIDAVPEQLGLELRRSKGPVHVWVVKHAEQPSPN